MDPSAPNGERRYAFGDSDAAAARLSLLAAVFEAPSRLLLEQIPREAMGLVLDLGCGPGHSTALLSEIVKPGRLIGLDQSDAFLARARRSGCDAQWYRHDLTVTPFPVGPADLVYSRLVLAHLPQAEGLLGAWIGQVAARGWLVVEEDVDILTEDPWLSRYEMMAGELVAARGGNLYIGRRLADINLPGVEMVINRVHDHSVPGPVAARMFLMNFGVWRHDALVVDRHPASALDELEAELSAIAGGPTRSEVVFRIRQLALRRR